MDHDVDITKYIIRFGVTYTIGLIVLSAISYIFDLDLGSGASIGLLAGSAVYSVGKFIRENNRAPSKREKSKMIWSSFVLSWLLSLLPIFVGALVLGGGQGLAELLRLMDQAGMAIIAGMSIFVSLVYLAVLYYCYGGLAKKQYDNLKKKGKI